jgi:hypothetical protein
MKLLIPFLLISLCGSAQTKKDTSEYRRRNYRQEHEIVDTIKVTVLRKANKISNDTWWPELIEGYRIVKYRKDITPGWFKYVRKDFKTEITGVIQEWEGFW